MRAVINKKLSVPVKYDSGDFELEKKVHEYLLKKERDFVDFWFTLSNNDRPVRPKFTEYEKLMLAGLKTDCNLANGAGYYCSYCAKTNAEILKEIDKYIESYKQKYPAYFIQFT